MAMDLKKGSGKADYLKKAPSPSENTAVTPIPQKRTEGKATVAEATENGESKKPWWLLIVLLVVVAGILFFLFGGGEDSDGKPAGDKSASSEEQQLAGAVAEEGVGKKVEGATAEAKTGTETGVVGANASADKEKGVAAAAEGAPAAKGSPAETGGQAEPEKLNAANIKSGLAPKEDSSRRSAGEATEQRGKVSETRSVASTVSDEGVASPGEDGRKVTIHFDLNSAELKEEEKAKLSAITALSGLKSILIEGHTCNMGETDYNRDLSLARAVAIREHLKGTFEGQTKLVVKGSGAESPAADNDSKEGRAQNRRVEVYY